MSLPTMALVTLQVLDGADRGRVFEDLPTPVTIGREEGNTIQLNDERVSRFHLKIQEDQGRLVLTDLQSTNGTKVNGEEMELRILRFGDMITVGRSVLLFGSRDQISQRLSSLRKETDGGAQEAEAGAEEDDVDFDFDGLSDDPEIQRALQSFDEAPELPERLSPAQAAQLADLLNYLHVRMRQLIECVKVDSEEDEDRVNLTQGQWQSLLDLQMRIAGYLREIGEPGSWDIGEAKRDDDD